MVTFPTNILKYPRCKIVKMYLVCNRENHVYVTYYFIKCCNHVFCFLFVCLFVVVFLIFKRSFHWFPLNYTDFAHAAAHKTWQKYDSTLVKSSIIKFGKMRRGRGCGSEQAALLYTSLWHCISAHYPGDTIQIEIPIQCVDRKPLIFYKSSRQNCRPQLLFWF